MQWDILCRLTSTNAQFMWGEVLGICSMEDLLGEF